MTYQYMTFGDSLTPHQQPSDDRLQDAFTNINECLSAQAALKKHLQELGIVAQDATYSAVVQIACALIQGEYDLSTKPNKHRDHNRAVELFWFIACQYQQMKAEEVSVKAVNSALENENIKLRLVPGPYKLTGKLSPVPEFEEIP